MYMLHLIAVLILYIRGNINDDEQSDFRYPTFGQTHFEQSQFSSDVPKAGSFSFSHRTCRNGHVKTHNSPRILENPWESWAWQPSLSKESCAIFSPFLPTTWALPWAIGIQDTSRTFPPQKIRPLDQKAGTKKTGPCGVASQIFPAKPKQLSPPPVEMGVKSLMVKVMSKEELCPVVTGAAQNLASLCATWWGAWPLGRFICSFWCPKMEDTADTSGLAC